MRIVHLACLAPPEIGGIGSVAAEEVAQLRERGLDACLCVPMPVGAFSSEQRALDQERGIFRLPAWRYGNAAILHQLKTWIKDADIVHLHYPFYGTAERLPWLLQRAQKLVLTFHMDAAAPGWKAFFFQVQRHFIQPRILSRADRVLVSSFDYAQASSLATFMADHAERVIELPFGVDAQGFASGTSERERFHLPADKRLILFNAGLDPAHRFKGLETLLQALQELSQETQLVVVGDGDLRATYEAQARLIGVGERVHFLGRLSADDLPRIYRSADVFACPSLNQAEAFGLVVLNAMASGLPVVASDLPGVRTVVQSGETGLLVKPGDVMALARALGRILSDRPFGRAFGQAGRDRVMEKFTWPTHTEGLIKTYLGLTRLDEIREEVEAFCEA